MWPKARWWAEPPSLRLEAPANERRARTTRAPSSNREAATSRVRTPRPIGRRVVGKRSASLERRENRRDGAVTREHFGLLERGTQISSACSGSLGISSLARISQRAGAWRCLRTRCLQWHRAAGSSPAENRLGQTTRGGQVRVCVCVCVWPCLKS